MLPTNVLSLNPCDSYFCQFHDESVSKGKGDMLSNVKLIVIIAEIISSLHEIEEWVGDKTVTV